MTGGNTRRRSFGSGAKVLSIGIASTGVVTFGYFTLASHALDGDARYDRIALLWSVLFVIVSVIYRPVEQLLSRTIADRRARGLRGHPLRIPVALQTGFALLFLAIALPLRTMITDDVFSGSQASYWILVGATLAYAASYFARGWLAGHERFGLYGSLVFVESVARFLFALAAIVGIAKGENVVAVGIVAAPCVSLFVVPAAFASSRGAQREAEAGALAPAIDAAVEAGPAAEAAEEISADLDLRRGAGFAAAVFAVMVAEQTLLNGAVLAVSATAGGVAVAGIVFNALLIARAPLQLFQAIQTSLLPHLTGLEAEGGTEQFESAIRRTVAATAAFALLLATILLVVGPAIMDLLFAGSDGVYRGAGLAVIALGMGFHLIAGTFNQAALARGHERPACAAWLASAVLFLAWCISPIENDPVLRAELGYFGATGLLAVMLWLVHRIHDGTDTADQEAQAVS